MRGVTSTALLLAPALASATAVLPEDRFQESNPTVFVGFDVPDVANTDTPARDVMLRFDVLESDQPCGPAAFALNGEPLLVNQKDVEGSETLTLGEKDGTTTTTLAARWNLTCLSVDGVPREQLLDFAVDAVDGLAVADTRFSVRFVHTAPVAVLDVTFPLSIALSGPPKAPLRVSPLPFWEGDDVMGTQQQEEGVADEELLREHQMQAAIEELEFLTRLVAYKEHLFREEYGGVAEGERCEGFGCFVGSVVGKVKGAANFVYSELVGVRGGRRGHHHGRKLHRRPRFRHGRPGCHLPGHGHGNHTHGNHTSPHRPWRPPHRFPFPCRCGPSHPPPPHHPKPPHPPHPPKEPHPPPPPPPPPHHGDMPHPPDAPRPPTPPEPPMPPRPPHHHDTVLRPLPGNERPLVGDGRGWRHHHKGPSSGPSSTEPGARVHHWPSSVRAHLNRLLIIFTALFLVASLFSMVRRRCCGRLTRADRRTLRAARRAAWHRRRDARRAKWAARKARLRSFWKGLFRRVACDDEEKEAMLRGGHTSNSSASSVDGSVIDRDLTQLRNAADVVGSMVAAEEGRVRHVTAERRPDGAGVIVGLAEVIAGRRPPRPLRSVATSEFPEYFSSLAEEDELLPAYEYCEDGVSLTGSSMSVDESSIVADGSGPGATLYTPSDSSESGLDDVLGRTPPKE